MRNQNDLSKKDEDLVDIGPLIEDMQTKINKLSFQHASLLDKINDLYIRLEIVSSVMEDCIFSLGISKDEFAKIAKTKAEEIVTRFTSSVAPEASQK